MRLISFLCPSWMCHLNTRTKLISYLSSSGGCLWIMATGGSCLPSTHSNAISRPWQHQVHTFFYKRKVLLAILTVNELQSERLKTKTHHTDTHTNTHTEIYSKSVLYYTAPVMNICRERQTLSGNHLLIRLHAWSHATFALHLRISVPRRLTGHKAHFSWDDASGFWELLTLQVMPSTPGPTPHKLKSLLLSSHKQHAKYSLTGRSAWETDFYVVYVDRRSLVSKQSTVTKD